MTKKLKRNIIIGFIIILLIFFILLLIVYFKSKRNNEIQTPNISGTNFSGNSIDTLEDYYPKGTFNLTKKYTGNLTNAEITDKTSDFIKLLININNSNQENYYEENNYELNINGITSREKFNSIEQKIKNLNKEELIYTSSRFDTNSIQTDNTHTIVKLYIQFDNCDEIEFTEKIPNDKTESKFIFE